MKCPNCGNDSISIWQKAAVSSVHPITCKVCGKKLGVLSLSTFIALLPFLILMGFGIFSNNKFLHFLLPAVGAIISSLIHLFLSPLKLYEDVFYEGKS